MYMQSLGTCPELRIPQKVPSGFSPGYLYHLIMSKILMNFFPRNCYINKLRSFTNIFLGILKEIHPFSTNILPRIPSEIRPLISLGTPSLNSPLI